MAVFGLGVTVVLPPLVEGIPYWLLCIAAAGNLFQILFNFVCAATERHGAAAALAPLLSSKIRAGAGFVLGFGGNMFPRNRLRARRTM